MSEKLTLEWCFKYPNAKIGFERGHETWLGIASYSYDYNTYDEPTFDISECKLILRPLSSLTDEEKEILLPKYDEAIKIAENNDTHSFESSKLIVDYYRSINIDIDGLQERGIAEYYE